MTVIGLRPNDRDLHNLLVILEHLRPLKGAFTSKADCLRWALEHAAKEVCNDA